MHVGYEELLHQPPLPMPMANSEADNCTAAANTKGSSPKPKTKLHVDCCGENLKQMDDAVKLH